MKGNCWPWRKNSPQRENPDPDLQEAEFFICQPNTFFNIPEMIQRLTLLILIVAGTMVGKLTAQVRVIEKPFPPRDQMRIPSKPADGYVLLPGRWVWHRPAKMYAWLSPVWVEPPKGKLWSPGYWKSVKKGWVWVPGKWESKKRYWNRI